MATIAQLTDLHIVEDDYQARPLGPRARLSYLSFGRSLDPGERRKRVVRALADVRAQRADHLIVTGDLTEDGAPAQFEALAEVLLESRIPPERITLIPGNHDAYSDGQAYAKAVDGPLRPFAATSRVGHVLSFPDVSIVPVSTAFHQSPLRSAGAIDAQELQALGRITRDPSLRGRPLIFAQHHPPGRHFIPLLQWFDGLIGHRSLTTLFDVCTHLYAIHGHTHHEVSKSVRPGEEPRIFSAQAVVDGASPLRLYEASRGGLSPLAIDLPGGIGALALPA